MRKSLILFAKNLIPGKVKTRIAKRIGDGKALEVYRYLLARSLSMVNSLPSSILPVVYFADYIEKVPIQGDLNMEVQNGNDLGERMFNAIEKEIGKGAEKVCVIGSDIYDLRPELIVETFSHLNEMDIVLGPAEDGGYYLIGMKESHRQLFRGLEWGGSHVLKNTIKKIKSSGLRYHLLETLNDVDIFEDIPMEILKKIGSTDFNNI